MPFIKQLLLIAFLILCCLPLTAQIINIEDKRFSQTDTSGLFGYVDLVLDLLYNGSKVFTTSGSARLDYIRKKQLVFAITKFGLVQIEGQDFVNNGFQHLRYNYQLHPRFTYEAFGQMQYNQRTNLVFRGLLGTGLRFKILKKEKHKIFFGSAYMYEYDEQKEPRLFLREHRLSNYLSFSLQPSELVRFAATTYYQPRFDKFADYRLSSDMLLLFNISKRLRFKVDFSILYDTEPPAGTPKTIYQLENGLRWEF